MHREIAYPSETFERQSSWRLYVLTGLLGACIAADVWPGIAGWLSGLGLTLPAWSSTVGGYRIALIAAIFGGARVLFVSLESLLEGRLGADLALAIACVAAILIGEPLVAAEIVFVGLLGECLEGFTFERTQRAVRRIVEVFPRRCWLLRDGQEVRIATSELQVGDSVVVKPGGKIPVDGIVQTGRSTVDQSPLTGESLPVDKGPGDEVLAGSLNQFGAITIEARRVAQETVAGQVIELTAKALAEKAPTQRTADRLARYFLPVVLGLAAFTFIVALLGRWWNVRTEVDGLRAGDFARAVYPALAVLVVACPCPLILATPAAIIAALGRLAGTGILLKGGAALERLAGMKVIAFDKTGTLTRGQLELGTIAARAGISTEDLLRAAASAEQPSEHLLARLILQEAAVRNLNLTPVEEFNAWPGGGIVARSGNSRFVIGSQRLIEEQGIAIDQEAADILHQLDSEGQSALLVCRDGIILGAIGARDQARPEAAAVVADLRALGVERMAILTGDRQAAAETIGKEIGIAEIHAGLLPDMKSAWIDQVQQTRPCVMVGDGINDAPSLARAQVGIAVAGAAGDLAAEAGDIILLREPLRSLPLLFRLARETVRIIHQNIVVFAFGVNIAGVVLTAWLWPLLAPSAAWYEQAPLAAVIYHQIGSFAVLLNSMRLLWFEREPNAGKLRSLREKLHALDHWMEHKLDGHDIGHWVIDHRRALLGGLGAILLFILGSSGVTVVGPDELAIVTRFGRPSADLGPGLHFCWPWPIEQIQRLQPARIQTVEIGFRTPLQTAKSGQDLDWANPHRGSGSERLGEESVMVTGDGNLIELQATLRYSVADARAFLFQAKDPRQILQATTEAALREAAASSRFLSLLTTERPRLQESTIERVRQLCERYGNLGIRLEGLALHDLHPPLEVVPAYHDVTRAMEAKERQVNEALAESIRKKRKSEAEGLQVRLQAGAAKIEKVSEAQGSNSAFLSREQARRRLSWGQEWRLVRAALAEFRKGATPATIVEGFQQQRRAAQGLQASLTDFRLFWDSVGRALVGRDKVIVDSEHFRGSRHLLFLDPEAWRLPALNAAPAERTPPGNRGARSPFLE